MSKPLSLPPELGKAPCFVFRTLELFLAADPCTGSQAGAFLGGRSTILDRSSKNSMWAFQSHLVVFDRHEKRTSVDEHQNLRGFSAVSWPDSYTWESRTLAEGSEPMDRFLPCADPFPSDLQGFSGFYFSWISHFVHFVQSDTNRDASKS